MSQLVVAAGIGLWIGLVLLSSQLRWFARRSVTERLRLYTPGGHTIAPRRGVLSVDSFRDVFGPLSQTVGATLARLFGVSEELDVRLRRVHSPLDVAAFRSRQVGWSVVSFVIVVGLATVARLPAPALVVLGLATPLAVFLALEQQVAVASERRQRRIFLELPVVTEQLGMLLSAGYSLAGALSRLAERGNGVCAEELRLVVARTRQGLTEVQALREWSTLADVEALDRLVSVLSLNREAGNLGLLIAQEARAVRREAHRDLLASIERKNLQVWIPVTVAALVPGVMLVAVPFIDALETFSRS
jgi:tight adherence protein C